MSVVESIYSGLLHVDLFKKKVPPDKARYEQT